MFDTTMFDFTVTTSTGGAVDYYFRAPYKCVVKDLKVWCQADPGDGDTVTVLSGSNTVGVATFGSTLSAGDAAGAYAADATYGKTVFAAGGLIKLEVSQCAAAVVLSGILQLDPFARTT